MSGLKLCGRWEKNCRFALAFRERSGECLPESTDLGPVGQISNASVVFLKKKK